MSVPWVDLTDPDREPSDAELEALMQSVCAGAIERDARTQRQFLANLRASIAQATQSGTASGLCGACPEEVAGQTLEP